MVPPPIERFHTNICDLTEFIQDIIANLWNEEKTKINPAVIGVAGGVLKNMNKKTLIESFIEHSYIYWNIIASKERTFFINNCKDIFADLPADQVSAFKEMFEVEGTISKEDEETIWEYFESLVKTCIHYIHDSRGPKVHDGKPAYSNNNFGAIKVKENGIMTEVKINPVKHAKLWNIQLKWG